MYQKQPTNPGDRLADQFIELAGTGSQAVAFAFGPRLNEAGEIPCEFEHLLEELGAASPIVPVRVIRYQSDAVLIVIEDVCPDLARQFRARLYAQAIETEAWGIPSNEEAA